MAWIGEIPTHWSAVRIGYVGGVANGSTPERNRLDYWDDGTVPWLSSGKVNDYIVREPDEYVTPVALRECSIRLVPAGSVLVGMVGEGRTRGTTAYMALSACINQNVAAIIPSRHVNGRFLHHVLTAAYEALRQMGRGGQQDAINCALIRAFRIPLAPVSEQERIAQVLDALVDASRAIEVLTSTLLIRLREYRAALITAAVTGRLAMPQG